MTRQSAAELVRQVYTATQVTARRVLLNMQEGKMLIEFNASSREELEKWLGEQRLHFDWLLRIELESVDGILHAIS